MKSRACSAHVHLWQPPSTDPSQPGRLINSIEQDRNCSAQRSEKAGEMGKTDPKRSTRPRRSKIRLGNGEEGK